MDRERHLLPALAVATGLAWMVAVLLVAANPKDVDVAGDLAYDRANRVHTLALFLLVATAVVIRSKVRGAALLGARATTVLTVGAVMMLVGNVLAFWGALVVGQRSEQFWGGLVGWLAYFPGQLLVVGSFVALARASRRWPDVNGVQRWSMGVAGVLLAITTATWAVSPAATLAPAVLGAFALLAGCTAVANAARARRSPADTAAGPGHVVQPAG